MGVPVDMPLGHYYFSRENLQLLIADLNRAIAAFTGGQPGTVGGPNWTRDQHTRLVQDIIATAEAYPNVMFAFPNQRDAAHVLRAHFVRDRVQQYSDQTDAGAHVTVAGLRVDRALGQHARHSMVSGPNGSLNAQLELVNPVFALGPASGQDMHAQWIKDRQESRARFGLV